MPRYFFDLRDDVDAIDEEGKELPDLGVANERRKAEAMEMICASIKEQRRVDLRHRIDIRDEEGTIVGIVKFEDAVTFVREGEPV